MSADKDRPKPDFYAGLGCYVSIKEAEVAKGHIERWLEGSGADNWWVLNIHPVNEPSGYVELRAEYYSQMIDDPK